VSAPVGLAGQTVDHARRTLTAQFRAASIDSAELDVRALMCAALGLDLTGLIASAARGLTVTEAERLENLACRRLGGEPVARIIGIREFWGLPLKLSADTLVPRPDTETVVALGLEILRAMPISSAKIADLGTGSGAILLALLHELPDAFGIGTDINEQALRTARENATDLGLAERVAFVACDYGAALSGSFDLIVSNPPYIRSGDIAGLAREVREHDPHRALDGGADGLGAYRRLIPEATRLLAMNGTLVVEAGQGQNGQIQALMTAEGLTLDRPPRTDLAGIPRAVSGRKMPP
jgi:release factor glutamine methyltransferase